MKVYESAELLGQKCKECDPHTQPYPEELVRKQLQVLSGWKLTEDGKHIEKTLTANDFNNAVQFLNSVAKLADHEGHHPDVHIENYRHIRITLWTHNIGGLSSNDFVLAAKIDQLRLD